MTRDEKREAKKKEIIEIAKRYKDSNGSIDLPKLRKEEKKTYGQISHYFGSIGGFLEEMGITKKAGITETAGKSVNQSIVRNRLAYDMLKKLRTEDNKSLNEIGEMYGVSRMYMSKLFRELELVFETEENIDEEEVENVDEQTAQ